MRYLSTSHPVGLSCRVSETWRSAHQNFPERQIQILQCTQLWHTQFDKWEALLFLSWDTLLLWKNRCEARSRRVRITGPHKFFSQSHHYKYQLSYSCTGKSLESKETLKYILWAKGCVSGPLKKQTNRALKQCNAAMTRGVLRNRETAPFNRNFRMRYTGDHWQSKSKQVQRLGGAVCMTTTDTTHTKNNMAQLIKDIQSMQSTFRTVN